MRLEDFVQDGTVYAAASVFPVQLDINSTGRSPVRFMLLNHPDGSWWAAAWATTYTTMQPEQLLLAKVTKANRVHVSEINLLVQNEGSEHLYHVIAKPSSGGCCGSRLKSWQPFGAGVSMSHRPYSHVQVEE